MNSTPPGWYPDPSGAPGQRYWDGTTWTQHTSGAYPVPPYAAAPYAAPAYAASPYVAPPYAASPYPAAPYSVPPRRTRWGLILGIVFGSLLLLGGGCAVAGLAFFHSVRGPADATNHMLAAMKAGDDAKISQLTCSTTRSVFTPPTPILSYYVESSFVQSGGTGTAGFRLTTDNGTFQESAFLRKENGQWKVCGFTTVTP